MVTYTVCEIFYSLQGEGMLQGLPMVFVRLSGCNLRCDFCDTKYAWEKGQEMTVEAILKAVRNYSCHRACLTGGEPFLQPLLPLVRRLKQAGYWVAAETNGTLWQELGLDWLTLSPKKEGLRLHQNGYDERFRKVASEFKYVITNAEDLKRVENNQGCPVILQPVDNNPEMVKAIIDFLKKEGRPQRFLRLQLQKVLNFR